MRSLYILAIVALMFSCKNGEKRVLVFSKTSGYRHESIGDGKIALLKLGKENNFGVDTTENARAFTEENLKKYNAVIFLSTTQDVLNPVQQSAFKRYIEAGGGFVGIHAAADTEYEWPWYGKLVGAYFKSHPKTQQATIKKVQDFGKASIPDSWTRTDEWYNYKNISDKIKVILTLDEGSYEGGENGENHPIAWHQDFGNGRAFYTGLGHTKESYTEKEFLEHVLDGINYAIGDGEEIDYDKATSRMVPEENRFTKTVLDFNLAEPTEMAVLPDSRILFIERRGNVKLYTPEDGKVTVVNTFNCYTKEEDGMIGLAADPNFAKNNWIYVFYSHPTRSANVLSRFVFKDNKIDMTSEKELLEVAVQRQTCCHTGGSLAFGPDGNLFVSTGDNTSPFESNGFSPSDERPGRAPFDAQKSSANTNDLRGKILRIHPEPDGTYTIPEGNLFQKGEEGTRPEIYVMGCRNPYRISVDQRTGFLYWGEVGPDAGEDDSLRGPRGYDEVNQAKKAGFFGWPYFVGKNYPYAKFDFAANKAGQRWDPKTPMNNSPNNTGKKNLPEVSPPFIWYPYAKSPDFPMMKDGSRNAMAGPIYYSENYKNSKSAFPDYFDGKLLIYDWMRNWMFMVSMDEQGAIQDIEPFMPGTRFNNIIDLAYGPEGKLYMLEYGTAWFKQNLDARLVRIDYNSGNRPPVAMLTADKFNGALPLTINFNTDGTNDPDGDKLTYELVADGKTYKSDDGNFKVTFDKPGIFTPEFKVTDEKGTSSNMKLQIVAGNEPPSVKAEWVSGNKTFFFPGSAVTYEVSVTDKEDGSTADGKIPASKVKVTFDYLKGYDMTGIAQGHQRAPGDMPGKDLIEKSDCKSCHLVDQKSAGPAYKDIAAKYKGQPGSPDQLAAKIIKGGSGVWGNTEMAAHPQISVDDARKMVDYILTLNDQKVEKRLPLKATVTPGKEQEGAWILTATYFDKATKITPSIAGSSSLVLRSPFLKADQLQELNGLAIIRQGPEVGLDNVRNNSSAAYKDIDLTAIKSVVIRAFLIPERNSGGEVELHLDAADGPLLARANVSKPGMNEIRSQFTRTEGKHTVYVVFKNPDAGDKTLFYFAGVKVSD
jgi:cytochrome c